MKQENVPGREKKNVLSVLLLDTLTLSCMIAMAVFAFFSWKGSNQQTEISRQQTAISDKQSHILSGVEKSISEITTVQKQQVDISKKQFQLLETERKSPLKGYIRNRFFNWYRYFEITGSTWQNAWWDVHKQKESTLSCSPNELTKEFAIKFTAATRKEEKTEIKEEFIRKLKDKFDVDEVKIIKQIEEDGHFHLTISVSLSNPRDVPVTINTVRANLREIRENHPDLFGLFLIAVEPKLYKIGSDRNINPLHVPFILEPKEELVLLICFESFHNVLEIISTPLLGIMDDEKIQEELNRLLKYFYYTGIEINGFIIDRKHTDLWPEFFIVSKTYPWY